MSNSSTRDRAGYVYVLSNPAMPGVVKIGRSYQGAHLRAKMLSNTSTPLEFVVEFEILCRDASAVEKRAHDLADSKRMSSSREFFRLHVVDAVGYVIDAAWGDWASFAPSQEEQIYAHKDHRTEDERQRSRAVAKAHLAELKAMLLGDPEETVGVEVSIHA
jgi:hypothetical protein